MGVYEAMRDKIGLDCVLSTGERVRILDALSCYEGDYFFVEFLEGEKTGRKERLGAFEEQLLMGEFVKPCGGPQITG